MVPVAVHHRRLSRLKKGRFPPVPEFAAAGNRPQKEEIPLALPFRKILPVAGEIAVTSWKGSSSEEGRLVYRPLFCFDVSPISNFSRMLRHPFAGIRNFSANFPVEKSKPIEYYYNQDLTKLQVFQRKAVFL